MKIEKEKTTINPGVPLYGTKAWLLGIHVPTGIRYLALDFDGIKLVEDAKYIDPEEETEIEYTTSFWLEKEFTKEGIVAIWVLDPNDAVTLNEIWDGQIVVKNDFIKQVLEQQS